MLFRSEFGLYRPHLNINDAPHIQKMMALGGVTQGPSIAGEAGPEAVIPLTHGPINLVIPELESRIQDISTGSQDTASEFGTVGNDLSAVVNEAVEVYQQANSVELEILDILRSIGYTSGAVAANQSRIYSAQVN